MKRLRSVFLCLLCVFGIVTATDAMACTADQIDTGTSCIDTGFTITTTSLSANATFKFVLSAAGTFYVDWGDGGAVQTINRQNDTTPTEYPHQYSAAGVKIIKFGGLATGYNTTNYTKDKDASGAAIRFGATNSNISTNTGGTPTLIKTLSGSVGSVFPTLNGGASSGDIPTFFEFCTGCKNLTSVSSTLFSGVTGAKKNMFRSVFDKCEKLTNIDGNLFSGVSGSAESMFRSAFYQCKALTSIPSNLFAGINGTANGTAKYMFQYAFYQDTALTGYISPDLFAGLHGETATDLFASTFVDSGLLTSCPEGTHEYLDNGYGVYKSSWSGKVSCEPNMETSCTGATYLDSGECVSCPHGYDSDTTDGKESVDECIMHCNAGTWTGEYEKLDYIQTTGTQYIDTGHLIETDVLEADFEISSDTNVSGNIGHFAGNQDALNGHASNFKDSTFGLWVAYPNPQNGASTGSKTKAGSGFAANTKQKIRYAFTVETSGNTTTKKRTVDVISQGVSKTENYTGSIISNNSYRLFSNGCVGGCNDMMYTGRMHWFKLYEDGNLVFDFIPVRRVSDGVIGMYDQVSGRLFTNAGTGDFVAGPVLETIGGSKCENVGYGYYSSASDTPYGFVSTRNACGEDEITYTENSTSESDCHAAGDNIVCSAGNYLPANSSTCTPCPAGSWCPGGVLTFDANDDNGITSCTDIGVGWNSAAGSDNQKDCYYLITLNKNGFSGLINANAGTGCHVVSAADGTTNAQLKLFYNTKCTMPAIILTQTGYAASTGWAANNTVGAPQVSVIRATTTTPTVTTYYARKGECAINYYKNTATSCGTCPAHSGNSTTNVLEYCTCADGYTVNGASNGETNTTVACRAIGNMSCDAGTYVPAETTLCETCPIGSYCAGGNFTTNANDQGINNCATEIDNGWTSVAGKSLKSDCYYPITLNKNGFSGDILANSGTGCQVLTDATGTDSATLQLFYNTACTLPTINLAQTGYSNAVNWTDVNTLGGNPTMVSTIAATTTTPALATYYAYKSSCAANYYKNGSTQCSACGVSSFTFADNLSNTCTCMEGFTVDGTSNGATTGVSGCQYVVENSTYLHAGEKQYKVLAQRRTTPSICIGMNNTTYYVSLVPTEITDALAVEYNNMTYSGCDIANDYCITDGVLYWADPDLYLKSNGTQYIDTGVVPDLNTAIEIEMADTTVNTYGLFGVKTGTLATTDEGFGISLSGGDFGFFRNGTSISAIPKDNDYHVYYLSNTAASIDGVAYNFGSATSAISGQWPMYMFGFNHKGTAIDKTLSIKYLKIWSGNTLIRHFVPVPAGLVIGNYTVPENGMWDIVSQTFYGGSGGVGNFQYGKEQ